jgi:predicted alpha/beta-fold hydrolase
MKYEKVTIDTDDLEGATLAGEISLSEDAYPKEADTLVIMLHDFPYSHSRDHDDLYGEIRKIFEDHEFQTLLFDFQSCGNSEGREEEFTLETARENLTRVLKWARRQGFARFVFVASGAAAALALEQSDQSTRMIFLFWPAIDLAAHAKKIFYEEDGKTVAAKGRRIGGDLLSQMASYDRSKIFKSLRVPVLIQYGTEGGNEQINLLKQGFNALRLDITSYMGAGPGLTDPRHRQMIAHHIGQFLHKYA